MKEKVIKLEAIGKNKRPSFAGIKENMTAAAPDRWGKALNSFPKVGDPGIQPLECRYLQQIAVF